MTRQELLEPIIGSIVPECDVTRECIMDVLADWDVLEVEGGAATAIVKGTEIHFAIREEHRGRLIRRGNTRRFLAPLLERRGFLTTRLTIEDNERRRFIERIGFKPTWADGRFQYFLLDRLPFERDHL